MLPTFAPKERKRHCAFPRTKSVPNPPYISTWHRVRGPEPPARDAPKLPPPGNLRLALTLGSSIGEGHSSVVFAATVDLARSSPEIGSLAIPLAVKVSRPVVYEDLQHDAFYYEEMAYLQGVMVPRFTVCSKESFP